MQLPPQVLALTHHYILNQRGVVVGITSKYLLLFRKLGEFVASGFADLWHELFITLNQVMELLQEMNSDGTCALLAIFFRQFSLTDDLLKAVLKSTEILRLVLSVKLNNSGFGDFRIPTVDDLSHVLSDRHVQEVVFGITCVLLDLAVFYLHFRCGRLPQMLILTDFIHVVALHKFELLILELAVFLKKLFADLVIL